MPWDSLMCRHLAIAARDVVRMARGPSFSVELGRRDGLVSEASRVTGKLPESSFNLKQLNSIFSKHNLTQLDMIALSGAHTIGVSHCDQFSNRLHSFSSTSKIDPSLDPEYAQQLIKACPNADSNEEKGLLSSDQVLFSDPESQPTVSDFASSPGDFYTAFITGIKKLGRSGVKTGDQGQIRKDCTAFNS
ncbi:Peroxidase [Heracleum sosnowskyi]|uniref:peroxidase n=1 Tax=Heracleum sosnowskyi TaxID=360622 RepID=A0AAD8LUG7_9APIA|nr:Peroxidase [Heracleum sosnowskyi]